MERTIVANFDTRRDAETAVEHLVQEHGIERADISVRAPGAANTPAPGRPAPMSRAAIPASRSTAQPELVGADRGLTSSAMPAGPPS